MSGCNAVFIGKGFERMQSEEAVPLYQRWMNVEGHLSSRAKRLVHKGLPASLPQNSRVCFLSYAYADLQFPKEFDRMFRYHRDEMVVRQSEESDVAFRPRQLATVLTTCVRIIAGTQQYSLPLEEIPDGWKTICVLEFPEGVPAMIDELPTVNGWGESREAVALCSQKTFQEILQRNGRG